MALCWEINRTDGVSLYFTNHDDEITVSGKQFRTAATFSASAVSGREGAGVDNLNITGLTSDDITEEDLLAGKYEDAEVIVYAVQWDALDRGLHVLKRGWLGEITSKGTHFETEVRGLTQRLQQATGRVYSLSCNAQLGDSRCGVDLSNYDTFTTTVDTVTDAREFTVNATGASEDNFQYGVCRFTSGLNSGRSFEVLGHKINGSEQIILLEKTPYSISPGDGVTLTSGCDKSKTTCKNKFGNLLNFRGFSFIPTEAEALETPNAR